MPYHCDDPEKHRVLLNEPTRMFIGGTTVHSGLRIKAGTKLLGLNDKSKTVFVRGEIFSNPSLQPLFLDLLPPPPT